MSYVVAASELLATAALELGVMESALSAVSRGAAQSTTSLAAAAADEVSARIAALFERHGREFQAVSVQAAQFHGQLVDNLTASARMYLSTEIANVGQLWGSPLIGAGAELPNAAAGVRLTVPGAGPLYNPRFVLELPFLGLPLLAGGVPGPISASLLQGYDLLNGAIGGRWFPDSIASVVNYPASIGIFSGSLNAPGANVAVAIGRLALHSQILDAVATAGGSPVQIAGLSMGSLVVNSELAYLAADPTAPPAHALQFTVFSSPELGLARTYLPTGTHVPLIDYTRQSLPNTQYDVSVVFGQYDAFGNPPDRPWNIPAVVNALFGTIYQHNTTSLVSLADTVELSSVTTPAGGTITTYMVPAPILPMLLPLAQLGVPQPIVGSLNSLLQPIVNAGYSSLTPAAGPYFSGGSLVGLF